MRLENKVALVTGASRGIGATVALRLAQEGADVIVNYVGEENFADARQVQESINALGRRAVLAEGNVADFNSAAEMVEQGVRAFGRIDILVNNAGINRDNLLLRMKEEEWDSVLAVDLKGVFNTTKAVTKYMMKNRYGRIISVSSVVGVAGNAGQANYAAAKAGVIGFTKSVAKELASRNITANAVAPGFIRTPMTDKLGDSAVEGALKMIPLGRMGEPEDIAKAVVFLASEDADYITGQILHVDGGMLM